MICQHRSFHIQGTVHRITDDKADSNVVSYMADVRCFCDDCGTPFQFLGINNMGVSFTNPMVSPDKTELRIPIAPLPAAVNCF